MKAIQDAAALLFVFAVAVLTLICVFGVWDMFDHDVITKSFETVGVLAVAAVIVIVAGHYIGFGRLEAQDAMAPSPVFGAVRRTTLSVLIVASVLLALMGVLAIWDVITDNDVLYKSVGSLAVLAFGSFIMVVTCMERENSPLLKKQSVSAGGVVLALVLLYLIFAFSGLFW